MARIHPAYDQERFRDSLEKRHEERERARQLLVDELRPAARHVIDLISGRIPKGAQVYTEGKRAGELIVKPSTMLQAAVTALGHAGLTIPKRVEISGPDGRELEIKAQAKEFGADLIVIGSHGRHGLTGMMLGSTANGVLHGSPCDVLTVRVGEE